MPCGQFSVRKLHIRASLAGLPYMLDAFVTSLGKSRDCTRGILGDNHVHRRNSGVSPSTRPACENDKTASEASALAEEERRHGPAISSDASPAACEDVRRNSNLSLATLSLTQPAFRICIARIHSDWSRHHCLSTRIIRQPTYLDRAEFHGLRLLRIRKQLIMSYYGGGGPPQGYGQPPRESSPPVHSRAVSPD